MNCLFCEIVKGNIPCDKVYENDDVLAFRDIDPKAPSHIIIIPKVHIDNILSVDSTNFKFGTIIDAIQKIAEIEGLASNGFRLVNNCKEDGGQTVNHVHFHMLGGRSMQWPPG